MAKKQTKSPEAIRKAEQRKRDKEAGIVVISCRIHKSNVESLRDFLKKKKLIDPCP